MLNRPAPSELSSRVHSQHAASPSRRRTFAQKASTKSGVRSIEGIMVTTWRAFAHKKDGYFWHVGAKRWVELHGLTHPIVEVEVTLDPTGGYWGWHAAGEEAK